MSTQERITDRRPEDDMSVGINSVTLAGRLAADAEVKTFPSGAIVRRLLVTVRVEEPRRRVDVLPVTMWDSADGFDEVGDLRRGDRVRVTGSLQRRFFDSQDGRRSRLEVIAESVEVSR